MVATGDQRSERVRIAQLWTLELVIETDDDGLVERLGEQIVALACPDAGGPVDPDHACPVPWFLITSRHDSDSDGAHTLRGLLNR
jgi:hypothetical protein